MDEFPTKTVSTVVGFLLFVMLFFGFVGCKRVPPGYVGIRVNLYGTQRGVEDFVSETGMLWYFRPATEIHVFPTFMQTVVWTKDATEGSPTDESITFNSVEASEVNTDIALQYSIQHDKVPMVFVTLRQDIDALSHGYLRSKVRDELGRLASTMKIGDIAGPGKQKLLLDAKLELQEKLAPLGITIDMISFAGPMRLDARVAESINSTIQATQKSIEAENKVKQIQAEAEQAVAKAKGSAEARLLEAKSKADSNRLLTESLSKELLMYEALQKWDGVMPKVIGGETAQWMNLESK